MLEYWTIFKLMEVMMKKLSLLFILSLVTLSAHALHGDTLIPTQSGHKPIKDLKVGDMVLSKNETTNTVDFQTVTHHYSQQYPQTVHLTVIDDKGNHQTITTNTTHPFFAQAKNTTPSSEGYIYQGDISHANWIDAQHLSTGDKLLSQNGTWQTVQSIKLTNEPLTAYNLTVNHHHTYFVAGSGNKYGVWVHNKELNIGDTNPQTGHKILATHKVESGSVSDYIVESTKPSTKGKLVKTKTQYYENPGHHDPKGGGKVRYNSTKSVLPENHIQLWQKSIIVKSDPKNRWATEIKNGQTIYHRFQDDGNGNFHWNGSTDGKTASGQDRSIKITDVPSEVKR